MASPQDCGNQRKQLDRKTAIIATGLTFLLIVGGFAISLATDSVGLFISGFIAVSVGLLALLLLLFGISMIRGGLATTDSKTVGLFILCAVALLSVLSDTTTLGLASSVVVVVVLGAVVPQLLVQYSRLGSLE